MRRVRIPSLWRGILVLLLLTAVFAVGFSLRIGYTRFVRLRETYIAMAKDHSARAAGFRAMIPKAQNDLEKDLRRQRDEAEALASWGEEEPFAGRKRQNKEMIAYDNMRISGYSLLAEYHDNLKAKYANASRWPLQVPLPDPPEPDDPGSHPCCSTSVLIHVVP